MYKDDEITLVDHIAKIKLSDKEYRDRMERELASIEKQQVRETRQFIATCMTGAMIVVSVTLGLLIVWLLKVIL